jgi:ABC-type branched-subunit amino acid transport system permease subunit
MNELLGFLAIGVSRGLVYGLLALGIVLIYKGSRTINFAHPYFGLLAAYLCWWLTFRAAFLPFAAGSRPRFALGAILAIAIVALNGFGIEHSMMRKLRGSPRLVMLVATIALAQGTLGLVVLLFNRNQEQANTARSLPSLLHVSFGVGSRIVTGADIQVLLTVAVVGVAAVVFFRLSRFGVAIRAAAENGEAARLLGISVDRVSMFTWVVGAILAAIAGILITEVRNSLDIATLSTGFLVRGLAAALVGGLTSLGGAVVGGLVVGLAESLIQWKVSTSGVPEMILLVIVIGILLVRPGGLFGQREETEDKVAFIPTLRELPARLRSTPGALGTKYLGALVVIFMCLLSLVVGPSVNDTFTSVVIYGIVGVSLTVLMGFTGQISLGHWGLAGVGAFTLADLFSRLHVPYLLALPLSFVMGMLVALVIGFSALRIRGLYLAIATLAFNLSAELFLFRTHLIGLNTAGVQVLPPKLGPVNLDSPSHRPLFFFSVVCLGLALLLARNIARSRTGRGFFAIRENEKAAATLGVGLTRYKLTAFAVSGGIAAVAGALRATYLGYAQAVSWDTETSLLLVAIVMIGGLGSLSGAILGAFVVVGLPALFHSANQWVVNIGTGTLLILVIVRVRGGLAGLVQSMRLGMVESLAELGDGLPSEPRSTDAQPVAPGTPALAEA